MSDLVTISQLINVKLDAKPDGWMHYTPERTLELANAKREKCITDFVDALSNMFGRIGMHGVCRLCFKGALNTNYWSSMPRTNGCCGSCTMLTATKCANKPIGCAMHMCGFTATLFPKTERFLRGLMNMRPYINLPGGYYSNAIHQELEAKITPALRKRLLVMTALVNAWKGER